MKKIYFVIALFLVGSLAAINIAEWSNIRFSGKTASSQVALRTEIEQPGLLINKVIYNPGSGISEYDLSPLDAEQSTYQANIPIGTVRRYIGLKKRTPGEYAQVVPVFYEGSTLPALTQLSNASTDVLNDNSTNYLDIAADYVSFSDTKFYTAIQNRGGGFPTSTNFATVYPSYMSVIADPTTNPEDPDVVVWAMAYMNVTLGGITPGLYKITGTSTSDLVRLGNIETQIIAGSNLLVMSCNIADLLADADFAAWYNPAEPVFGLKTIINRTTVIPFATTLQDESDGAVVYPRKVYADPFPNTTPLMSGGSFSNNGEEVYFSASYQDTEHNFALSAQIEIQNGASYDLIPQSFDYSGAVPHRTADLSSVLAEYPDGWARVVVSDDNISYFRGEWFSFQHVLGLRSPEEIAVLNNETETVLSWEPVTLTLLGNPVNPDYYRVEASSAPDFSTFQSLGTTSLTTISIPSVPAEAKKFYRVIAVITSS